MTKRKPKRTHSGLNYEYRPITYWPESFVYEEPGAEELLAAARVRDGYMPPLRSDEVTLVNFFANSMFGDSRQVRARRRYDGVIAYSIRDEFGGGYRFAPMESLQPLSLRELIDLVSSSAGNWDPGLGLSPEETWTYCVQVDGLEPSEAVRYIEVTSDFYPELRDHYAEEARKWVERIVAEGEDC